MAVTYYCSAMEAKVTGAIYPKRAHNMIYTEEQWCAVVCTKHALRIEEPFAEDLQHYTTTPLWTHLVQSLLNFSHFFCVFFGIDH